MDLPASSVGDRPRENRFFPDPMTYYHEHYLGLTRGELKVRDPQLYACLRRNKLLGLIPEVARRQLPASLAAYRKHYAGLTRGELRDRDAELYQQLRRKGLLAYVPQEGPECGAGPVAAEQEAAPGRPHRKAPSRRDPLTEYQEDYAGWTRSELSAKAPHLYTRLSRHHLLALVPKKPLAFGEDLLDYYRAHYAGLTRGMLCAREPQLYYRLRKAGLLEEIPLRRARRPD
jgi:hypothetical protein